MEIKDRIQMLMEQSRLNSALFAEKIKITAPALHHILNGRNNASLDVIMKIHQAYDYKINLEWLLYGTGDMFSKSTEKTDTEQQPSKAAQNIPEGRKLIQNDLFSAAEISMDEPKPTTVQNKRTDERLEKPKQQDTQANPDDDDTLSKTENKTTEIIREIQYVEKPVRQIVEIRIFYDNGTYQVFHPSSL